MGKGQLRETCLSEAKSFRAVKLSQPCAKPNIPLSPTRHTCPMEPTRPARIVWILALVFLALWWLGIAWLAIQVTETIVMMLRYVVELAQLE